MTEKYFTLIIISLLLLPLTLYADQRQDLQTLSLELLEHRQKNAQLKHENFDSDNMKAELNAFLIEASDEEIDKAYQELKAFLSVLKQQNKELIQQGPIPPPEKTADELALIEAKKQYRTLTEQLNNRLFRNKNLSSILLESPFNMYHQNNIYHKIDDAMSNQEQLLIYRLAVDEITIIQKHLDNISAETILAIQAFKANMKQLEIERNKLEQLNTKNIAHYEKFKTIDNKAKRYIDDAQINCNAEPVDFSCHSRCEISVRDPIFGHVKTDYDRNCLARCNNQENKAQRSVNQDVRECVNDRNRAIDKVNAIEGTHLRVQKQGLRLQQQLTEQDLNVQTLSNNLRQTVKQYEEIKFKTVKEISDSLIRLF